MTAVELQYAIKNDPGVIETKLKSDKRILVKVDKSAILKIAELYLSKLNFRFATASAYESKEGLAICYHFVKDSSGLIVSVNVVLPKENPSIDSLAAEYEAFNWIEREMHELTGIAFVNHPQPEKLFSDGNWEEGVYPLRKNKK